MSENQQNPKVSVITPLYNAEKYIGTTIESVLNQTYSNWEMIIVDDGSADKGLEIAEKFARIEERIKIISGNKNMGAAKARNKAIEAATGRFIAFLDSDDLWLPQKLENQISFMLSNDYAFTYTAYRKISEDGKKGGIIHAPEKLSYHDILKTCSIGCLTVIYDTQKLGKMLMPDILKRQDFGLWLSILKKIPYAYGLNITLAEYRVRTDSISGNKWNAAKYQWKVYREIENLGIIQSAFYFTNYFFHGLVKTYLK
jgi:teichuronic acid biosynthesis glycosyltransferase TuaG